jgi:hypothetical protein
MTAISIDRLTLHATLGAAESQRLARLIAEGLLDAHAVAGKDVDAIGVTVESDPSHSIEWLAQQIVAGIARQIERNG